MIYVADGDQVVVFPKNGRNRSPLGVITNGVTSAYGLCVDRERDLYVVNQGSNIVGLYPPGATSPSRTYSEGLKRPLYCVTDSRLTLYVGNADGGQIVEYRRGSKAPRRILNTHGSEADGLGVDAAGNLYAAYRRPPYSDGSVELFVRGSARGWILGMRLTQPQGLAIDGKGDVIVAETGGKNVVDLFVPGHTKPSRQIAAGHIPNGVALGERDAHLYVSDLDDEVYALRYPNGALRVKIDNSLEPQLVQGLAVSPVAP